MQITAIIQARVTSKRFPDKIREWVEGKSILDKVVLAVLGSSADKVIVSMPWHPKNPKIRKRGVIQSIVVCDEGDVLARFYCAVKTYKLKGGIVRITTDCPLLKPKHIDYLVNKYRKRQIYWAYDTPAYWPSGFDVEVFPAKWLIEAHRKARGKRQREHVTPWIRKYKRCVLIKSDCNWKKYKFSVDTEGDLERVRWIAKWL